MPRSLAPTLVATANSVEHDLDGVGVTANGGTLLPVRFIHADNYRAQPDVRAIVHGHAASLISFSVSSAPMETLFHNSAFLTQGVPVFEIRKTGAGAPAMTDMLVGSGARRQSAGGKPCRQVRWWRCADMGSLQEEGMGK